MRLLWPFIRWVISVYMGLISCYALATPSAIDIIGLHKENGLIEWMHTPVFVQQPQSGLTTQSWDIELPASLSQAKLPALLIPQPIQGGTYKINGILVYDLPGSDENELTNCHSVTATQARKTYTHEHRAAWSLTRLVYRPYARR
jgi:hypothetical protein